MNNQMIMFLMALINLQNGGGRSNQIQVPSFAQQGAGFGRGSSFINIDSQAAIKEAEQILENATYRNSVSKNEVTDLTLKAAQSYLTSANLEQQIEMKVNQVIANRMMAESSMESGKRANVSGQEVHELTTKATQAVSSSGQLMKEIENLQSQINSHGQYSERVYGYINQLIRSGSRFLLFVGCFLVVFVGCFFWLMVVILLVIGLEILYFWWFQICDFVNLIRNKSFFKGFNLVEILL